MIDVWILWPVWLLLAALVLVAWFSMRIRLGHLSRQPGPQVDDEAIRQIMDEGHLTTAEDEPLDIDEVRREEQAFWEEERWDEADDF
jgi:hypothetical protein